MAWSESQPPRTGRFTRRTAAAIATIAVRQARSRVSTPRPAAVTIGAHVLLLEDEAGNAAVAQGYLAELGCSCVWVDNGSEAVARSSRSMAAASRDYQSLGKRPQRESSGSKL